MNTTIQEYVEKKSELTSKELNLRQELKEKLNGNFVLISGYNVTIFCKEKLTETGLNWLKDEYYLKLDEVTRLTHEYHYNFVIDAVKVVSGGDS